MNKKYQNVIFCFILLSLVGVLLVNAFPIKLNSFIPTFTSTTLNVTYLGSGAASLGTAMMNISGATYNLQVDLNSTAGAALQINVTNVSFWYSKDNTTWTRISREGNESSFDAIYNSSWDTTAVFGGEANNLSILVIASNTTNASGDISQLSSLTTTLLNLLAAADVGNITYSISNLSYNGTIPAKTNITGVLIDNLAPKIIDINVTARMENGSILGNTILNGSLDGTGFIKFRNQTLGGEEGGAASSKNISVIQIAVQIADLHTSSVWVAYNISNGPVNKTAINITLTGLINFTGTAVANATNNSANTAVRYVIPMKNITVAASQPNISRFPANPSTWLVNITMNNYTSRSIEASNLTFLIVVNDTVSHFSIASREQGYKVAFDNGVPVPTLTLSTTSISVLGSVTITCSATDPGAGVNGTKTEIYLQKPSATSLSIFTTGQETVTLSGSDTGEAGTYYTSCVVEDNAGSRVSTSALSFIATYSTTNPSDGGGGGGPPGAAGVAGWIIDLSKEIEGTIAKAEGASISFTVDGTTGHKISFDKVTAISATITIASDPITMTLNVGETKEITLDGQKLGITLKGIISGQAQLTIKKLGAVAPTTPTTEQPTTPTTGEEPTEEARSYTWLWVLIVLVIIAVLAVYFVKKKKPY